MEISKTGIEDLFTINYSLFTDKRGAFVKTIHDQTFKDAGLKFQFDESFYSISKKNVLRGMHYQTAPHSHSKLVYVIAGRIIDVVLDIRNNSATFGSFFSIELSSEKRTAIYIGEGFAHGFLSLEEDTIVEYHTTTAQNKDHEGGIKWDSFNYDWDIVSPIISDRDKEFESFDVNKKYFI
jgi:dTDP-4-dehydrorhamnose 3,5-epimerase